MSDISGSGPLPRQLWYVYILKCSNGMPYTGCTNNLEERFKRHNAALVLAAKNYLPVELVTFLLLLINLRLSILKNI
jgi:predicted GIY-YIG superfamily endonuclease